MGNKQSIVGVRNLIVSIDGEAILECDSFEIEKGDRVVVSGDSGAGKTVFCQAILGHLCRVAPKMKIEGTIAWNDGMRPLVGYVPQGAAANLHPSYRVGDQLWRILSAIPNSEIAKSAFKSTLSSLRLGNSVLNLFPHELSGGMCQRLLMALSISVRPSLLVLDEPTASLDGVNRIAALSQVLHATRSGEIGLLYITHRDDDAALMATRTIKVSERKVRPVITPVLDIPRQSDYRSRRSRESGVDVSVEQLEISVPAKTETKKILTSCSFRVRSGERVGVIGESASGKSTLLKCLAGLLSPTQGSRMVLGMSFETMSHRDLRKLRRSIQLVSQDAPDELNPLFTVSEVFREPSLIHGHAPPTAACIEKVLTALNLRNDIGKSPIRTLSFGQKQRVAIGRAIAGFPDLRLLLLDEPTSGSDKKSRACISSFLRDIDHDVTVIVASHDLAFVEATCERAMLLRNGLILEKTRCPLDGLSRGYGQLYRRSAYIRSPHELAELESELSLLEQEDPR